MFMFFYFYLLTRQISDVTQNDIRENRTESLRRNTLPCFKSIPSNQLRWV